MKELIGKNVNSEEVKKLLEGKKHRIIAQDGEHFMVTMDYNPLRINLTLNKGVITDVSLG